MVILGLSWWHVRARIHSGFSQFIHCEAFSQQYLLLSHNTGNFIYLPFAGFLVDRQIPVGYFHEQMAVRNT